MNIRVHLPSTEEGWEELHDRLAAFHSEFIINEINKLPCSYEEKIKVAEGIAAKVKNKVIALG